MFGYVTIQMGSLSKEQCDRYRAFYCGLCRSLKKRYGGLGQITLSYDATFLLIILSSLYEPDETGGTERCVPHPFKPHAYIENEICGYCADMNIALAYHKCKDNWMDDRSVISAGQMKLLEKAYNKVHAAYPEKCAEIERCLLEISKLEHENLMAPDAPANLTAQMLGIVYRYKEDMWGDTLQHVGEALGRFIYLMDAYDDLPADIRKKRYNPLQPFGSNDDYEDFVKDSLTLLIAECTEAFEILPLVQDIDILRNILYAGCWSRYEQIQQKRDPKKGKLEPSNKNG
ncbi:MAG: hypothetical protein GX096_01270 [Clostridiales bacterium]|nr:hypothetical protein [Clostridiales bacterium]